MSLAEIFLKTSKLELPEPKAHEVHGAFCDECGGELHDDLELLSGSPEPEPVDQDTKDALFAAALKEKPHG